MNIAIDFPNKEPLNKALRKIKNARWSTTHKCWYVALNKENYNSILYAFKGLATIEPVQLSRYLEEKKKGQVSILPFEPIPSLSKSMKHLQVSPGIHGPAITHTIHSANAHVLPAMKQALVLKSYSASTIKTYLSEVAVFLRTIGKHSADEFSVERLKDYLQYCAEKLLLTENSLHSRMNALKFYYEQVLRREKFFWDIPRPKKPFQLPKVLSKEEMIRLIRAIENLKHRTMIMLGYACGLRVSEITGLQLRDVDEDRRLLLIQRAKGKKDRVASLSPAMMIMIREYLTNYKPEKYLFEGQHKGVQYSARSLQSIIQDAKIKAGIDKSGSMHMLRHSFATHLIDKGTDVVFIQKLLGHNDIKTTLRYLHVTNKDLLNILSPLEDIKDFL